MILQRLPTACMIGQFDGVTRSIVRIDFNRDGTIVHCKKDSKVDHLPETDTVSLKDEAARQPYDNLSPEDQAKIDNVDQLEADKVRLEKLMEVPFAFSLSGNALNMVNTGIETGYRGYVYKVEVLKPFSSNVIKIFGC
ncbi:hypothetical protein [Eubacterium maltosivorans]|uniref:hypothetical protein n=1 Tax=Eubacterium maltosivorans TaxID=2041044 RepID=UPI001A9B2897|nr:hypothetical protein [Eubacterium maltosivorans]